MAHPASHLIASRRRIARQIMTNWRAETEKRVVHVATVLPGQRGKRYSTK